MTGIGSYILLCVLVFVIVRHCTPRKRYISSATRKAVFWRDRGRCRACGGRKRLEYDHVKPFSRGGSNHASNIQLLCRRCNRSKSARYYPITGLIATCVNRLRML